MYAVRNRLVIVRIDLSDVLPSLGIYSVDTSSTEPKLVTSSSICKKEYSLPLSSRKRFRVCLNYTLYICKKLLTNFITSDFFLNI
jgi:hypothetical protein